MTIVDAIILFFAAMGAGALNSVAGGGSFISFPALMFTGVPPVNANTTNTVALVPGSIASIGAYRKELAEQDKNLLIPVVIASLIGGLIGAIVLLNTPQSTFKQMLPFLMLLATLMFAFGRNVTGYLRANISKWNISPIVITGAVLILQVIIGIYGGFFGGGIGIMMLAVLSLTGMDNIHQMNALKTVLQTTINGIAVIAFVLSGTIYWGQAVLMIVGAIAGGFGGAYYARQLDPARVRQFVIGVGTFMTIYFFMNTFVV